VSPTAKMKSALDPLGNPTGYKIEDSDMIAALRQLRNGDDLADKFETALRVMMGPDPARRQYWLTRSRALRSTVFNRVRKSFE
jgi:hypothetical protein